MTHSILKHTRPEDLHRVFSSSLHARLSAIVGRRAPTQHPFFDFVLDYFDMADFDYLRELIHPTPDKDWHVVIAGPAAGEIYTDYDDTICLAESRQEAFSFVLQAFDRGRVFPESFLLRDGGRIVELHGKDGLAARISPVVFEPDDVTGRRRVETALKGLRRFGENGRIVARLTDLPGLANISPADDDAPARGAALLKTVASIAGCLRAALKTSFGIDLKQHQVQTMLADTIGAKNWAHLIRLEDASRCRIEPVCLHIGPFESLSNRFRFYRTPADGVWAFSQQLHADQNPHCDTTYCAPSYHGSGPSEHGIYMTAPFILDDRNEESGLTLSPLSSAYGAPGYDEIARSMLSSTGSLPDALRAHFGSDELGSDQRMAASNARLGIDPERFLKLHRWQFSILNWGESHKEQMSLHVEELDNDGVLVARRSTKLYKALIEYNAELKQCVVIGDYGRNRDIVMQGFERSDADALLALCIDHIEHGADRRLYLVPPQKMPE